MSLSFGSLWPEKVLDSPGAKPTYVYNYGVNWMSTQTENSKVMESLAIASHRSMSVMLTKLCYVLHG